jgi:hypothetical protein
MTEQFTEKEKQIIEKLAKRSELIRNFDDIKVFSDKEQPLASCDVSNGTLYLNTNFPLIPFKKLLAHLDAIIVHETGHLDKRLLAPSTVFNAKKYAEFCKKKGIDRGLINFVTDMEIHYQYNKAKMVKPIQQLKLKKFLTEIRNMIFETDKGDLILSLSYPTTEEQKKVKEIIENRQLTITEKVERIDKMMKKKEGLMGTAITGLILPDVDDENGNSRKAGKKKKGKPEKMPDGKNKGLEKAKSIKKAIEKAGIEGEIREKLASMSFSDEEINELLQKSDKEELLEKIEHLENSFNKIIPSIEETFNREKSNERIHSRGYRLNGYHKLRDITEVTENVEDLVTLGKYDMNGIEIPTKIDRKNAGIVIILRDVSGSIGDGDLAKIVRDTTVGLIQIAKRKNHKIAVIDFHSQVEPIFDSKNEILTKEYNKIMLESMLFKNGYSTLLTKALEFVNKLVTDKNMIEVPINLFIISDSYVDETGKYNFVSKRVNLVGIWCKEEYQESADRNFVALLKSNNGKLYCISKNSEQVIMELIKDYIVGGN